MKRLISFILLLACLATTVYAEPLDQEVLLSYYDNSVFFGDSIMQGFRRYRSTVRQTDTDFLESVTVVATSSISLYDGTRRYLNDNVTPFTYRGRARTMYQITKEVKPEKVFILLGLNDPVGIKIDKAIGWVEYAIKWMGELNPGVEVYFFSMTPVTAYYCKKRSRPRYPEQVDQYNVRLQETCEKNGVHYINICDALKDEDGYLAKPYTSDSDCHLSDEGVQIWLKAMCDYAQSQYDQGLWTPASLITAAEEAQPTDAE